MPSISHESLVNMFRMSPAFAVDVLATALGVDVPAHDRATVTEADLSELVPVEHRADLVIELWALGPDGRERRVLVIVAEPQLAVDVDKEFSWPVYAAAARAKFRCPAYVLVIALDAAVAAWAAQPLVVSPGRGSWRPLVFGPSAIPEVTEPAFARVHPELAVLSALAHANRADAPGESIVRAIPAALGALDVESGRAYLLLLRRELRPALRKILEALMVEKTPFGELEVPEWLWKAERAATKQGLAKGRAEGRAEALLTVLAARGIAVSEAREAEVRACTDDATLTRWLTAAVTAKKASEVFGAAKRKAAKAR